MRTAFMRMTALSVAILARQTTASAQVKGASWLDEPKPASWNKPGIAIPAAPKIQAAVDPRCRDAARPPQLDEEKRVRDQGWDLVGAYHGGWQIVVIRGTGRLRRDVPTTPVSGFRLRARCVRRYAVTAVDGQPH
jgi:hypothetical protein